VATTRERSGRDKGGGSAAGQSDVPVGEALDQALSELEKKIERVRTLYEQYFMGIEKVEPQVARKDVTRTLLLYAQQHIRNTGQRFRFHSLQQKWNIYITLWNRTMREIEAGTYRRDVLRVQRKLAREGVQMPEEVAVELKLKRRHTDEHAGAEPPPGPSAPAPAPPASSSARPGVSPGPGKPAPASITPPPGMTDGQMRELYRRYVQAKRLVGDANADGVRYEALVATVAKQTPTIMEKYGVPQVEFTVVIKDDKVVLKAIPKKSTS